MIRGFYVFEPTTLGGESLGKYGPYTIQEIRSLLRTFRQYVTNEQIEHALAITQKEPKTAFVLSCTRPVRGQEMVIWTAELTWFEAAENLGVLKR